MKPTRNRTIPAPTWMPPGASGLRINTGLALLPLSLGLLLLLGIIFRLEFVIVVTIGLLVPFLYAAAALYLHRALPRFDQEFNRYLQAGDLRAAAQLLTRSKLFRLIAPSDYLLGRRGLLLVMAGHHERAEPVLEEAWERAPKRRRMMLIGPMTRVKYELGRWGEVKELASQWRARSLFTGSASLYLAAAAIHGDDPDYELARELLDRAGAALGDTERGIHRRLSRDLAESSD